MTDEIKGAPEGYTFVRMPDGTVQAVSDADIKSFSAYEKPKSFVPDANPDVYLHLADGSVERVKTSEAPLSAGTTAPNGFYIRDGKAYQVTGVYPVETAHEE